MKLSTLTILAFALVFTFVEFSVSSKSALATSAGAVSPVFGDISETAAATNSGLCPPLELVPESLAAMHEDHRAKVLHFHLEAPSAPQVGQEPTCTVPCTYVCTIECTHWCTAACTWECTGDCTHPCTYPCTDPCTKWCTYWCTEPGTCAHDTICVFTTPGGVFGSATNSVMQVPPVVCVVPCTKACTYICTGECTFECTGHCTYDCTFECTYTCTGQCTYPCTNFCTQN